MKFNRRYFLWAGISSLSALEALSTINPQWTKSLQKYMNRMESVPRKPVPTMRIFGLG